MNTDLAIDTNILAYAEGVNGLARRDAARELLDLIPRASAHVPIQVLGELFGVLIRKKRMPALDAMAAILRWYDALHPIETSDVILLSGMRLAAAHGLRIWDAIILSAAADAGCTLLLSEDMQDGFTWHGVTVVNPFKSPPHPLLVSLLDGG